jgi:crotonobetainyl-CoA:carnitine CoA-transferase CaiB-like acyl-CoA transferase
VVHALSGIVDRQATIDGTPPVDPHTSIADMNAALHGLTALLSALYLRERGGPGQHIDLAMLDAMVATDDYIHMALDDVPPPHGIVNHVWQVASGHIVIAGDFRWVWQRLQETAGLVDPTPSDAPLADKIRNRHRCVAGFLVGLRDRAALAAALERADLAWGDVQTSAQVVASETLAARGSLPTIDDRQGGERRVVRSPYRFSAADSGVRGVAPYRGEHNRQVLAGWAELSDAEIDGLIEAGVLLAESLPQR